MNEQTNGQELVGQLLDDRVGHMVYRVESVDEDAFPSEQQLTLRPVYVCKKHWSETRSDDRRANLMAGTGHQSIRWVALVSKVTELDVERMRENDQ